MPRIIEPERPFDFSRSISERTCCTRRSSALIEPRVGRTCSRRRCSYSATVRRFRDREHDEALLDPGLEVEQQPLPLAQALVLGEQALASCESPKKAPGGGAGYSRERASGLILPLGP